MQIPLKRASPVAQVEQYEAEVHEVQLAGQLIQSLGLTLEYVPVGHVVTQVLLNL